MPRKAAIQETEEQIKEPSFNFDKSINSVLKEMEINAANIQRGSFISNSISSGFLVTDLILGGGYPGGRFVSLVGAEGGGKSTYSFYGMREAIKLGTYVIHLDYEGATDSDYCKRIGLRIDWMKEAKEKKPVMYRNIMPNTGEDAFNLMHRVLKQLPDAEQGQGIQCMFVLDSLPSMLPKAIDENDEAAAMAIQARMFSTELKKVKTLFTKKNCILFAINQLRERPGPSFGDPTYEPCGFAPRQYSDIRVRIDVRSAPKPWKGRVVTETSWDKNGADTYRYSLLRTVKNKMFGHGREGWSRFFITEKGKPGSGIDPVFDTFEYLRMTGQVDQSSNLKLTVSMPDTPVTGKTVSWNEFKALIQDPANKVNEETYLPNICRRQLESGEGFQKYFDTLGGVSGSASSGGDEDAEMLSDDVSEETADV